jgi:hypothetical protein
MSIFVPQTDFSVQKEMSDYSRNEDHALFILLKNKQPYSLSALTNLAFQRTLLPEAEPGLGRGLGRSTGC